jgi:hypothetical protein
MKTANIGNKVVATVEFDIEKIEREGGIVCVSGFVEAEGKKRWVTIPLEFCNEGSVSFEEIVTKNTALLLAKKFIAENTREDEGGHKAMMLLTIQEAVNSEVAHV